MSELQDLVASFGTPMYVYRLEQVDAALAELGAVIPQPSTLYYSLKANPHPEIAARLAAAGCGAEVSSGGELAVALAAGFPPERCMITGPAKANADVIDAIDSGVKNFSVESAAEFRRIGDISARYGIQAECLIRVNADGRGATGLRMAGVPSQFGVDLERLLGGVCGFTMSRGARVVGAHFFPISNARDEQALIAEMRGSIVAAAKLREFFPLSMLDLGGGFAAPYASPGLRPSYPALRAELEGLLDEYLPSWRIGEPAVVFESGRYLVSGCGRLVCTVVEVKQSRDRTFVLLDTGIHHLGGMAGLGRLPRFDTRPAAEASWPVDEPIHGRPATLAGPLCTPADVLGREVPVGPLEPGDLLILPNVGAYGLTASLLGFLSHPPPIEVVLEHGQARSASRLNLGRTVLPVVQDDPVLGREVRRDG